MVGRQGISESSEGTVVEAGSWLVLFHLHTERTGSGARLFNLKAHPQ